MATTLSPEATALIQRINDALNANTPRKGFTYDVDAAIRVYTIRMLHALIGDGCLNYAKLDPATIPNNIFNPQGDWAPGINYVRNDFVRHNNNTYLASRANTSSTANEPTHTTNTPPDPDWMFVFSDGEDGTSDTPEQVRDKLRLLTGEDRLSYNDLKDTPTIPDAIQGSQGIGYLRVYRVTAKSVTSVTAPTAASYDAANDRLIGLTAGWSLNNPTVDRTTQNKWRFIFRWNPALGNQVIGTGSADLTTADGPPGEDGDPGDPGPVGLNDRGDWTDATGTIYAVRDMVDTTGGTWRCFLEHTPGASNNPDTGADRALYWRRVGPAPDSAAEIVTKIGSLTGEGRLSYNTLKDTPDAETGQTIVTKLESLTGDERFSYDNLKDTPESRGEGAARSNTNIARGLETLTGDDRFSYNALKDTPDPNQGAARSNTDIARGLETLTGNDRFDYNALKNRPDPNQGGASRTFEEIADGLDALTGDDRFSYNSLKDKPTIGPDPETWAQDGDTSSIPNTKLGNLPSWIRNDSNVPANRLGNQGPNPESWAEDGDTSDIPADKLDNAPRDTGAEIKAKLEALVAGSRLRYEFIDGAPERGARGYTPVRAITEVAHGANVPSGPVIASNATFNFQTHTWTGLTGGTGWAYNRSAGYSPTANDIYAVIIFVDENGRVFGGASQAVKIDGETLDAVTGGLSEAEVDARIAALVPAWVRNNGMIPANQIPFATNSQATTGSNLTTVMNPARTRDAIRANLDSTVPSTGGSTVRAPTTSAVRLALEGKEDATTVTSNPRRQYDQVDPNTRVKETKPAPDAFLEWVRVHSDIYNVNATNSLPARSVTTTFTLPVSDEAYIFEIVDIAGRSQSYTITPNAIRALTVNDASSSENIYVRGNVIEKFGQHVNTVGGVSPTVVYFGRNTSNALKFSVNNLNPNVSRQGNTRLNIYRQQVVEG